MELQELAPGLWLARRTAGDLTVSATLVLTRRFAVVVDTLLGPADMAPFRELIAKHRQPVLVINTHADWDHCWGNAAFAGAPVLGHRLCRERVLRESLAQRAEVRETYRDVDAKVAWIPPGVVFERELDIHCGDVTLQLRHLPGHTADSLVVYLPEWQVLIAGDAAEVPFPTLDPTGAAEATPARQLRNGLARWQRTPLRLVIPGHGPAGGPDLLARNVAYLDWLHNAGQAPAAEPPALDGYLGAQVEPFYQRAHAANWQVVLREAGWGRS